MATDVGSGGLLGGFEGDNLLFRLGEKSSSGRRQTLGDIACGCGDYRENRLLEVCRGGHGC
jgi:hypothetical protein